MRVWKQYTEENRTTRKTSIGRRNETSVRYDQHLLLKEDPPHGNSSTAASTMAHEHRDWQADWHQVVFSDESRFNLWAHDGRICVRRNGGECCIPWCVNERHSGLTPETMDWGVISYHGR
ncbi:transposable element Tc1 transposase [Trichonephila clavipes]|nr:transposable element Tc1 transposase [Trichonephila clavipes]